MFHSSSIMSFGIAIILTIISGSHSGILNTRFQNLSSANAPLLENNIRKYGPIALAPGGTYTLEWTVNEAAGNITFVVVVETSGYVGFGISDSGVKSGSDIVIMSGPVDSTIFMDYHGSGSTTPTVDRQQDWALLTLIRENSLTTLEFTRLLYTSDFEDIAIKDEDVYILWAHSRTDDESLSYHGPSPYRGSYKINLVNPELPTQPSTQLPTDQPTLNPSTTDLPSTSYTEVYSSTEASIPTEPPVTVGPVLLDPDFGRYFLSWEIDRNLEIVTFTAVVHTNGFVGFGISKAGTMAGADIVAAEFNDDGRVTFKDYHATGHSPPIVDDQQNWTLETYQRNGTHTFLVFSRPFDTQDSNDVVIRNEKTNFIFAISRSEFPELVYHGPFEEGFCGIYPLNILGESTTEPTATTEPATPSESSTPMETEEPFSPTTPTEEPYTATTEPEYPSTDTTWPAESSTTLIPGTDIMCDFQEILVHPFPAPCYVEFLCNNLMDPIFVNNCGFVDTGPRIQSKRTLQRDVASASTKAAIECDFKDILVHPFPTPCRVEFYCNNFEEVIHVNNCGFIDIRV